MPPFAKLTIPLIIGIFIGYFTDCHNLSFAGLIKGGIALLALTAYTTYCKKSNVADILIYVWSLWLGIICMMSNTTLSQDVSLLQNSGFICQATEISKKNDKLKVVGQLGFTFDSTGCAMPQNSSVLMYVTPDINIQVGDYILSRQKLDTIPRNSNPGSFDYKAYLRRQGIIFQAFIKAQNISIYPTSDKFTLNKWIHKTRSLLDRKLAMLFLDKDNYAIISAMILGTRDHISNDIIDGFRRTGAIHILAVSGLHVGIIAGLITLILYPLMRAFHKVRSIAPFIQLVTVWIFVLLCGAPPSVVRAAGMFSLYFVCTLFGRHAQAFNIIFAAAFLMLIVAPMDVMDIGFQFSFLALAGIFYFLPRFISLIYSNSRLLRFLWTMVALSVSAQIFIFPLSIHYFNSLSNIFWLSGIIAVPLATVSLSSSVASLVLSFFQFEIATRFVTTIAAYSLTFLRKGIGFLDRIPFAMTENFYLPPMCILAIYLIILAIMLVLSSWHKCLLWLPGLCLCILLLTFIFHQSDIYRNQRCIIYDIYRNSAVDIFYQGSAYTYNTVTPGSKSYQFNINPARLRYSFRRQEPNLLPANQTPVFDINQNCLMIYPGLSKSIVLQHSLDYLIINDVSLPSISFISNPELIGTIIFDSSIRHVPKTLIDKLINHKIQIIHTLKHGAVII